MRPLIPLEKKRKQKVAWDVIQNRISHTDKSHPSYNRTGRGPVKFRYQRAYGKKATTTQLYEEMVEDIVYSAMEGYHGTVFAYGQTSSGKTYTMLGTLEDPGILPLCVNDVFKFINATPERKFLLRISYIEIYKEQINDLLDPTKTNLRLRQDAKLGMIVDGAKEEVVLTAEQVLSVIIAGESHRHIGVNDYNDQSSRSHTVFRCIIESQANSEFEEEQEVNIATLQLIDLAGSEKQIGTSTRERKIEAAFINKSLLTLGTIISRLSEGSDAFLPYRQSKLTRLLKPALSGETRVTVICAVSPAAMNFEETMSTLMFAKRAKRVVSNVQKNKVHDDKALLKKYCRRLVNLKEKLKKVQAGEETGTLKRATRAMRKKLEEKEHEQEKLEVQISRLTKMILVSNNVDASSSPMAGLGAAFSQAAFTRKTTRRRTGGKRRFGRPGTSSIRSKLGEDLFKSSEEVSEEVSDVELSEPENIDEQEILLANEELNILKEQMEFMERMFKYQEEESNAKTKAVEHLRDEMEIIFDNPTISGGEFKSSEFEAIAVEAIIKKSSLELQKEIEENERLNERLQAIINAELGQLEVSELEEMTTEQLKKKLMHVAKEEAKAIENLKEKFKVRKKRVFEEIKKRGKSSKT